MIRKAIKDDIESVAALYDKAISYEDAHIKYTSWQKDIYPTADTARAGIEQSSLFVIEENEKLLASVILNHKQPPEYRNASWSVAPPYDKILVIHTLCVDPESSGRGIGTSLVNFIKDYAKELRCVAIRLNTTAKNEPAKHLYEKNGFVIADRKKILLNGQIPCDEHLFMEYVI